MSTGTHASSASLITRDSTGTTLTVGDLELVVPAGSMSAIGTRFYAYNGQTIAERNATTGLCWTLADHQGTACASARFVTSHSPVTKDKENKTRALRLFDRYGGSLGLLVGAGGGDGGPSQACFGRAACQAAWNYLNENPDDIEGVKWIAALCRIDNMSECLFQAKMEGIVQDLEQGVLVALALGAAGAGRGLASSEAEASSASGKGAEPVGSGCPNSFAGDTPVLMADGTSKAIDEVRVGDDVANAEPDSDKTQRHTVTALHVTDGDRDFVDVSVGTPAGPKSITSTAHHLFWDATTHAWTNATDLEFGDQLNTPGDGHATVLTLRRYTATIRTYNLTVDAVHTYYVLAGPSPILVHNSGPCANWSTHQENAGGLSKKYAEGQTTRDPASQWYHEELSNNELLAGINNVAQGDGIVVSRGGRFSEVIIVGMSSKRESKMGASAGHAYPYRRLRWGVALHAYDSFE